MSSQRLPGKVLMPIGNRTMLEWVLRAAVESATAAAVVVATSTDPEDDPIAELVRKLGTPVVRGSREDVLSRFIDALDLYPSPSVIRLTADCPMLDPAVIAKVAREFDPERWDYAATALPRTLPRGLDVEIASAAALRKAARAATGYHRSHVTSYLYAGPEPFRCMSVTFEPDSSDLRITVDTDDDLEVARTVADHLGDRAPSWQEVVAFLRSHPEIAAKNRHVVQKDLEQG